MIDSEPETEATNQDRQTSDAELASPVCVWVAWVYSYAYGYAYAFYCFFVVLEGGSDLLE